MDQAKFSLDLHHGTATSEQNLKSISDMLTWFEKEYASHNRPRDYPTEEIGLVINELGYRMNPDSCVIQLRLNRIYDGKQFHMCIITTHESFEDYKNWKSTCLIEPKKPLVYSQEIKNTKIIFTFLNSETGVYKEIIDDKEVFELVAEISEYKNDKNTKIVLRANELAAKIYCLKNRQQAI